MLVVVVQNLKEEEEEEDNIIILNSISESSITAILFCVFASVCLSVCLQYQNVSESALKSSLWSVFGERKLLQNVPFF